MPYRKYDSGVTLIELMISLVISFIILNILLEIYISAKKNFMFQSALATLQENALTALQTLKSDINAAGFTGCARLSAGFPLQNHTDYSYGPSNKLIIDNATMTTRHMDTLPDALQQDMLDSNTLHLTTSHLYIAGEPIIIADCQSAEVVTVKSQYLSAKNSQVVITTQPLTKFYGKNSEAGRLIINTYFVKMTNRKNRAKKPINALYFKNINNHTTEIAEGIDTLQYNLGPEKNTLSIHLTVSSPDAIPLTKDWYAYASAL
jgi:Tfp pilus assembly protein PilW